MNKKQMAYQVQFDYMNQYKYFRAALNDQNNVPITLLKCCLSKELLKNCINTDVILVLE